MFANLARNQMGRIFCLWASSGLLGALSAVGQTYTVQLTQEQFEIIEQINSRILSEIMVLSDVRTATELSEQHLNEILQISGLIGDSVFDIFEKVVSSDQHLDEIRILSNASYQHLDEIRIISSLIGDDVLYMSQTLDSVADSAGDIAADTDKLTTWGHPESGEGIRVDLLSPVSIDTSGLELDVVFEGDYSHSAGIANQSVLGDEIPLDGSVSNVAEMLDGFDDDEISHDIGGAAMDAQIYDINNFETWGDGWLGHSSSLYIEIGDWQIMGYSMPVEIDIDWHDFADADLFANLRNFFRMLYYLSVCLSVWGVFRGSG